MEFAAGLTLLQFSGDLHCGCAPRKYCNPVEQQQKIVARGLRDSCIELQACDVFEQPTPGVRFSKASQFYRLCDELAMHRRLILRSFLNSVANPSQTRSQLIADAGFRQHIAMSFHGNAAILRIYIMCLIVQNAYISGVYNIIIHHQ